MSDADAAMLYHSFDAQRGSHAVLGSTLLRQPVVVKERRDKGRETRMDFATDGEKLTTCSDQQELVWRRVQ